MIIYFSLQFFYKRDKNRQVKYEQNSPDDSVSTAQPNFRNKTKKQATRAYFDLQIKFSAFKMNKNTRLPASLK